METRTMMPAVYPIDLQLSPYDALCALEGLPYPVLLESAAEAGGLGVYSIVAAAPRLRFECGNGDAVLFAGEEPRVLTGDPLDRLQALLLEHHVAYRGPLPFYGGAIGTFSYDLKNRLEKLPTEAKRDIPYPEIWLGFYDWALIFDHPAQALWLVVSPWEENPAACLSRVVQLLEAYSAEPVRRSLPPRETPPVIRAEMEREAYLDAIRRVKDYIRSGDIYQVNYTQRFHSTLEGDALTLYGKMRQVNPAPFAAYVDTGAFQVVSASPERFIRIQERTVETRPIKGTRPRGATPEEDAANRQELLDSEKDRAELLMIVDLERNDLGRMAETGTVEVTELFKLETYATVFHLVATVKAKLRSEVGLAEVLRASFPGGSITGAPKIRAMEIIDELEPTARNLYTGSIGYIGYNGDADLNIVIRTILCQGNQAWFQVGGGIVWDSDPELEYAECHHKARGQIAALSR